MLKRFSIKLSVCFTLALLLFTSFKSINAYASEKKDVTVTVTKYFDATESQFDSEVRNSIINSTYDYNDGSFKGTLHCSDFQIMSQTLQQPYPVAVYRYTVKVSYYGTVSNGITKSVTVTVPTTFEAPENQLDMILSYIQNYYTYNYNDGTFSGTLYSKSANVISKTVYEQNPDYTVYRYTVNVTYTGTVSN